MSDLPLSAVAEINPAVRIPKGLSRTEPVSFIPRSDVSESGQWTCRQSRTLASVNAGFTAFEDGDVLVAKITPCLENGKGAHAVGLCNGIGFGSTEFHVLRARTGNNPRYVFHLTRSRLFRRAAESRMVGSAGQKRVQRQFFDEFYVANFGGNEQAQIASILDVLDIAIQETEAIIVKLKAIKQGLLHDLLTRGIDANGELRPPRSEAPHLYKQSPLGWIPREWLPSQISELLASVDPAMRSGPFGSALLKEELTDAGIPLLGIDNVHTERFVANYQRFVTRKKFLELSRYAVRPADLMITIMGTVGRCCLMPEDVGQALFSKHTWAISLDQSKYSPYLAMLQINFSPWAVNHFARDQQGGTMAAVRSETLRTVPVPVPPRGEQYEIERRLRSISSRIELESDAGIKLRAERSGLMDDLLTGRVRVTPVLGPAAP